MRPFRPYIFLQDHTSTVNVLEYAGFAPPSSGSGLPVVDFAQVNLVANEAGSFRLRIWDKERTIDRNLVRNGCSFFIFGSKNPANAVEWQLMHGFVRADQTQRDGYDRYLIELSGFGSQIIFNERIINYIASAPPDTINPAMLDTSNPYWEAWKHFIRIQADRFNDPLGQKAVKDTHSADQFLYEDFAIDTKINMPIGAVNFPYVEARQALDTIADTAGAVWGTIPLGFPSTKDYVYFWHPTRKHSGITVKDSKLTEAELDRKMSYCRGGFTVENSMRVEDGFANRLYSQTATKRNVRSTTGQNQNYIRLAGLDLAQQFTIDSVRLRNLAIKLTFLQKEYEINGNTQPLWTPQTIFCAIVNDVNDSPGPVLLGFSWFNISLDPGQATRVNLVFPANFRLSGANVGQKAWLIVYQNALWRLNIKGFEDVLMYDVDNSLNWNYNDPNARDGTTAWRWAIFKNNRQDRDPPYNDFTSGWVVNKQNWITFDYLFQDEEQHYIECSDPDSIDYYGQVDGFIDVPFITDVATLHKFLSSVIMYTAMPKMTFNIGQCTLPDNSIFYPGIGQITFSDTKSGMVKPRTVNAELAEVTYTFDAMGGQPLGCQFVELSPVGYYDFRNLLVV
jgi:hypothetical protein